MTPCTDCNDPNKAIKLAAEAEAFETPRARAFANGDPKPEDAKKRMLTAFGEVSAALNESLPLLAQRVEHAIGAHEAATSVFPELAMTERYARLIVLREHVKQMRELVDV